mmetsp:Transcript_21067/g.32805  ORF Transcript_21067/g.32805 Transcript_21067/m.32805 type:complete len:85 (-) Transcript_21067:7-261(-)
MNGQEERKGEWVDPLSVKSSELRGEINTKGKINQSVACSSGRNPFLCPTKSLLFYELFQVIGHIFKKGCSCFRHLSNEFVAVEG